MTPSRAAGNKALMRDIVRIFETGDLANVATLVNAEYLDHQGLGGTALKGAGGFSRVVTAARTAVPDLRVRVEDLIAEGDRVVARLRWYGTRPTGEQVDRETIEIVRFARGQAVEHWGTCVATSENLRDSPPHSAPTGAAAWTERPQRAARPPTSLTRQGITHVGLKVSSAGRSQQFYREILGLEGQPREPGVVYVPSGRDTLILYEEGKGATAFHFGFNADSPVTVDKWKDWLKQNDVRITEDVRHDKYRSIKFQDPDGHWVEVFCEE